MSLPQLAAFAAQPNVHLVSTDIFDTVLLRDHSTETGRLAQACHRSAASLGLDPRILERLRWRLQDDAYRAVAVGGPSGEARLTAMYDVIATILDLDSAAAEVMLRIEVDSDIEHLRPNRRLIECLENIAKSGTRVIAVSDTYYNSRSLDHMLEAVVGAHPIEATYSSADLGLTKHVGHIFDAVAAAEGTTATSIVHVGDNHSVDVRNAERAGWTAVHLPRIEGNRMRRSARRARDATSLARRLR